ncbi:unnamed protein product [Nyctereutes procyonoides]|uniref:(raccoon dog) hypothetical protein n=1 Tax=Nyctereutes procyonoides TaxID=34880 RepID=A0A811YN99_NYCPR|nr:unnamed protein product [Nyctereutes procyonoides]
MWPLLLSAFPWENDFKLAFLPPDPTYTMMCDEYAIECFMTRTSKGTRIACINDLDLGQMSSFYIGLGSQTDCTILCNTKYGIFPENVIICGQSRRTGHLWILLLGVRVLQHSSFSSFSFDHGMGITLPDTWKTYSFFFDALPNIDKISKITAPVLIIQETEGEVSDFSHGAGHNDVELYGRYLERLKHFGSQELLNLENSLQICILGLLFLLNCALR